MEKRRNYAVKPIGATTIEKSQMNSFDNQTGRNLCELIGLRIFIFDMCDLFST
jgi:hypothetical protein